MTRITGTLREDKYTFFLKSYFAHFFLEWEIFQTKAVEKIKKKYFQQILSKILPFKI